MLIRITYCSNYNGCNIYRVVEGDMQSLEEVEEYVIPASKVVSHIIDEAVEQCDDEGFFEGDIEALEQFAKEEVTKWFGEGHTVTFEEDTFSS